jgi:DNA polymerase elongation subunit (family B)
MRLFFGFIEVTVEVPENDYMPLLGIVMDGRLVYPTGTFKTNVFSEELKLAMSEGVKIIEIHAALEFEREIIFDEYIEDLYERRLECISKGDAVGSYIYKIRMNSSYGRWGMREERECTKLVNDHELYYFERLTNITSMQEIGEMFLITFTPTIDMKKVVETCKNISDKDLLLVDSIMVLCARANAEMYIATHISAAVSSYSRIAIHKMKRAFARSGCSVCYSDTDSIYVEGKIPNKIKKEYIGKGLGLLKVEMSDFSGIFIAPKTTFVYGADFSKVTFKGLPKKEHASLSREDFESFLAGGSMHKRYTLAVSKHMKTLSVQSVTRVYSTRFDKLKRDKILNKNGL